MSGLDPLVPVYFIYGLAFFTMGVSLALLSRNRIGDPIVERGATALATFGLLHGFHEWYEMFLLIEVRVYGFEPSLALNILRLVMLFISFVALCLAGCYLYCQREGSPVQRITPYLLLLFGIGLTVILLRFAPNWEAILPLVEVWTRYSLGMTGAVLAGAGLVVRGRVYKGLTLPVMRGLNIAGGALIIYGVFGQSASSYSVMFPSNVYNAAVFQQLFGFPVQLLRTVTGIVATAGLVTAMRALDVEYQRTLRLAIEAKLEAQSRAQQEMARRQSLQKELLRRTVSAQEDERARIARELHDQTGQTLTALNYRVAALGNGHTVTPEMVASLKELAGQALADLRGLVTDLRPAQLDDLGLVAALSWLADQLHNRLDLGVEVSVDGRKQRLPDEIETSLFRIAQEALTNIARHAEVDEARMSLCFAEDQVVLEISDQGRGFDVPSVRSDRPHPGEEAWGIMGMEERASIVGGHLDLSSRPGEGTVICVTVPLVGETKHDEK